MAGGLSIKNLHDLMQVAALSHPSVKSFGSGERHLISPDGGTVPVNVWLEQPFFRTLQIPERGSPTRTYRVQFMVLDIPMEDRSDELDIISRCDLIADWIIIKLHEETDAWIGQSISVMSLAAYHGDLWAGVRVELELTTGMPIDACDVRNL